jgi:hypothetical protein
LDDRIISLRGKAWVHKTSLTPPPLIEMPAPSQERARLCISVRGIDFVSFYDFSVVPTVWYYIIKYVN